MDQYNFTWIEPDTSDDNLLEVDELLTPSFDFFDKLEIQCMSECCGIGAFSFKPGDIEKASKNLDKFELIEVFERTIEKLNDAAEKTVISSRLNNLFNKSTFIQLLEHTLVILREEI
jgi:Family of unknown function (DUF6331)